VTTELEHVAGEIEQELHSPRVAKRGLTFLALRCGESDLDPRFTRRSSRCWSREKSY